MAGGSDPALAVLDWGTTHLRSYLVTARGDVLAQGQFDLGVRAVPPGGFATVYREVLAPWSAQIAGRPIVLAGMVGSSIGWVEAPYVACPAGLEDLARGLMPVPEGPAGVIVPGLMCRDAEGRPDIMRGEETQLLGALTQYGDGLYGLPGTHSKWVEVAGGRILRFATYMTGEAFGLFARMSVLSRTLGDAAGPFDAAAFHEGAARAASGGALLRDLFAIRARSVVDGWPGEAQRDFLSGLFIGAELAQAVPESGGRVVLIGAPDLTDLYGLALARRGVDCVRLDGAVAVVRGAARIAELWRAAVARG